MKVQQNIGIMNALIRITCGFTMLAWSTAKLTRRPWRDAYLWVAMLGAMKVAEGIVRYCPVVDLFDKGNTMMNEKDFDMKKGAKNMTNGAKNLFSSNKKDDYDHAPEKQHTPDNLGDLESNIQQAFDQLDK
nr:DUF2892 domain-containing protein [Bacillus fonticola]